MLIGPRLFKDTGLRAARRLLKARPRKRLSIALAVYLAVVLIAALAIAIFVGDSGDARGWQTGNDGQWLVAVLPASEYRPPGGGESEGWSHLYVMCDRLDGVLRIGLSLGTEAGLQESMNAAAEVGIWEVVYTVGEAGGFAEVWASVGSGDSAYLSPPEPDAVSDRFLAGGYLVAWAADLGSAGGGHEAVFDLDTYAEEVASEMGGCKKSIRA